LRTTTNSYSTFISPQSFNPESQLNQLHDNWLIDLNNTQVPLETKLLLQLGGNFSLPLTSNNHNKMAVSFIKHIEKNLTKTPESICEPIRNLAIPIIKRIFHTSSERNEHHKFLTSSLNITKTFTKEHPEVFVTKADKGNTTVILNKQDYITKMTNILSDTNTYAIIHDDPTKKLSLELRTILTRWKSKEFIDLHTYRKTLTTDGLLPRAYGLPKIHKPGFPLRIIVSSIGSPLYALSNYMHNLIKSGIPTPHSFIKNSYHLVNKLSGTTLDPQLELASLDVVSLFTNVPSDLVFKSIQKRWELISRNTAIPVDEFLCATKLNSTYFSFNRIIYKQIFGTPMGSPLSPIVSDIVLQDLETLALQRLQFQIPIYYRYVDDILLAAHCSQFNDILDTFNSFHPRLKFTLENSFNNEINFLDTKIIIDNCTITFDLYRKSISSVDI